MEPKERKKTLQPVIFSMENDQCVWSRAGITKPTKCVNAFDCLGCAIDKKVLGNFDEQRKASGSSDNRPPRTVLMMRTGKCRHMLSGRIPYGSCSYAYDCVRCPFDQMIEDTSYLPNSRSPQIEKASGFDVARDYYYHHGHAWARVEYGGRVRIGLDDFALRLLGPQDQIELPKLGSTVGQNRPSAVLKRSGNEAASLSPVDGVVVATNHEILKKSTTANDAPYAEGWLMVIQPKSLRNNLKNLYFDSDGVNWIDNEASRLTGMLSGAVGHPMMPTGGEVIKDIYGAMPEIGWDRLVKEFMV